MESRASPPGPTGERPLPPLLAGRHEIQRLLHRAAFDHDFFLQQRDRINQLLGTRWTAGDIDIHGNNLIHALHQRVIIENTTGSRAGYHRDDPLRFRHLLPELANYGGHFVRDATGNNHQVRLPRRRPEHFGSEARDIEARCAHRHHFDRTAGEAKRHRPDGILAHPVDGRIERSHDDAFRHSVSVDEFLDYFLSVFDDNVGAETELLRHEYILTAGRRARRESWAVEPRRRLLHARNHEEIAEPADAAVRVALAVRRHQDLGDALRPRGVSRSQLAHELPRAV